MLVRVGSVRGIPISAPFLRASRLHPLIEVEASDLFLSGKLELGVVASMRAVEVRVRKKGSLGDYAIGVGLMNRAFRPGGPLIDPSAVNGEQQATRVPVRGRPAPLCL